MNMEGISFKEAAQKLAQNFDIELSQDFEVKESILKKIDLKEKKYQFDVNFFIWLSRTKLFLKEFNFSKPACKLAFSIFLSLKYRTNSQLEEELKLYDEFNSNSSEEVEEIIKEKFPEFRDKSLENLNIFVNAMNSKEITQFKKDRHIDTLKVAFSRSFGGDFKDMSHRIIFPFVYPGGFVLGFSGRTRFKDDILKYLTRFSFLFSKEEMLYNLFNAYETMVKYKNVFLTEGPMDTERLKSLGIQNVVSVSGTGITLKHLSLISIFSPKITIVMDGDNAGQLAAKTLKEKFEDFNFEFVVPPENMDPDEWGLKYPEKLKQELEVHNNVVV